MNFQPRCATEKHSPIPLKIVGVMRGTKTIVDSVSDNAINGAWTKAKGVRLLEMWTEMTRVQILAYWTSCKIHVGECKSHEEPGNDRTPQHLVEISVQLTMKLRGNMLKNRKKLKHC